MRIPISLPALAASALQPTPSKIATSNTTISNTTVICNATTINITASVTLTSTASSKTLAAVPSSGWNATSGKPHGHFKRTVSTEMAVWEPSRVSKATHTMTINDRRFVICSVPEDQSKVNCTTARFSSNATKSLSEFLA